MTTNRKGALTPQRMRAAARFACALCALILATGAVASQRTFASAEEAADALVKSVKAGDRNATFAILGTENLTSADPVADHDLAQRFAARYEEKHAIEPDGDARATLTIGSDDWPFAFPLVKSDGRWHFDAAAGEHELLARRIGENELAVMNVMLAIVDAEREYGSQDHDKDGIREYARKFVSSPGRKDGLYWETAAGEPESPLGPLMRTASAQGYRKGDKPTPYHGYYFRILQSQGSHAKGGALDYVVKGHMIGGFAAVAYPAQYRNTGVMTFIVNHDGVVYQKDLGPETAKIAKGMARFDPGPGWTEAKPD